MTEQKPDLTVAELQDWLRAWVASATGVDESTISDDRPMEEMGLSSRDVVALSADIEDKTGVTLTATVAYQHPTIASLAKRIIEGDPDGDAQDDDDLEFYSRTRGSDDDIAIVGLATRFPGGGETPESTWDELINGRTGVTDLPEERWAEFKAVPRIADALKDAHLRGGYLPNPKAFDADFFQMSPKEAEMVDPQQRLALELTWEALEHARIPASDVKGDQVGVFMGSSTNDYQMLAVANPEGADESAMYALLGTSTSIVANRVSYFFDFHGPSVAVDTACSSSLVALHQAVRSLREGQSSMAIAGGVNYLLTPAITMGFDKIGVQSKEGRVAAFSSDADGMVRAEGGGVVVLKRLSDARRDGDNVLAVVAGTAYNSDGRSNGLFAPNPEAQVACLREAYRDAAIHPKNVDYIDAHGTGTILGDPLEADALGRVVGRGRTPDQPLLIGSAKTNFGHLEAAAGTASLAKALLTLQHNTIPASLNFTEPNPYIPFGANNLKVVTEPTELPKYSGNAIIGVTGNGFGGTNAHVVLRAVTEDDLHPAPETDDEQPVVAQSGEVAIDDDDDDDEFLTEAERFALSQAAAKKTSEPKPVVAEEDPADTFAPCAVDGVAVPLVISGFLPSRRRQYAKDLLEWLESDEGRAASLADIGRALAHRNHGRSRAVVMASTYDDAVAGVRAVAEGKPNPAVWSSDSPDSNAAVWVMSGFGGQHRKMGKQLYLGNPVFKRAVDEIDAKVQKEIGWSIVETFLDDNLTYENIAPAGVGIFTVQVGLAAVIRHHGGDAGAVIGQSVGEIAGAYITGGLSLDDAVRVVCQRCRLMGEGEAMLTGDAIRLMALVEYSADEVQDVIAEFPGIEICVYNAPNHTVIGGPEPQIDAVVERAVAAGKMGRKLHTRGASHTSQMDPLLGEFSYELTGIAPQPLSVGLYSSVDREQFYRPGNPPVHGVQYWLDNLREKVYFAQAVAKAVDAGHTTFIEVSAHPIVLMSVAATTFGAGVNNAELIEALHKAKDENASIVEAMMKLYVHGHPLNVGSLFGAGDYAPIPRTKFLRKDYWLQTRIANADASTSFAPGAHVALPDGRHVYEVTAAAVTDLNELVRLAASAGLSSSVTVTGTASYGPVPPVGSLTTTVNPHPGGASVQVHHNTESGFRLLFDAVVVADESAAGTKPAEAVADTSAAPVAVAAPTEVASAQAPASEPGDAIEEVGGRWSPDSGESVEDRLVTIVSESMGYAAEDLPREIPLIELGLDSLMAMRIKNRVEWEFDIPQMQLQAMRDANLQDLVKFVSYAVNHKDEVAALAEHQASGGDVDTAKISEFIDAQNSGTGGATPEVAEVAPVDAAAQQVSVSESPAAVATDQESVSKAAGSDVPPRDAAERLTFSVWAVVTGKSAGGIFNKLPVLDEDTAQKLADRLGERCGGEIDVEDVLDSDTIETMADYVRKELEDDLDGFVRVLRAPVAGSQRKPLFVFHPAGGSTVAYEPLVKRLPEDIPVYGFERIDGPIPDRIEQYLPKLKELAPEGPYVLAGWSLGGALAYNTAQALTANGDEVAFVGILDLTRPNNPVPDTEETRKERILRWYEFAKKNYGVEDMPIPLDRLAKADEEGQIAIIMEMMKMSNAKIPGGIIEHQRTSYLDQRAMVSNEPTPWDGKVVLYRSDRMHDGAIELEPEWADIAPDGRWGEVVDDLEVIHIGGDHLALIDEPYIAKIGADMSQRLNALANGND